MTEKTLLNKNDWFDKIVVRPKFDLSGDVTYTSVKSFLDNENGNTLTNKIVLAKFLIDVGGNLLPVEIEYSRGMPDQCYNDYNREEVSKGNYSFNYGYFAPFKKRIIGEYKAILSTTQQRR